MLRKADRIEVLCNFWAVCRERGKTVPGTLREGHNVFTTTGRDWLAHAAAWQAVGSPDVPFTGRRLRWIGVGTGTQLEVEGVTQLNTPVEVSSGMYLAPIQTVDFPATGACRVYREFATGELSFPPNSVVPVTEAGMFVDVFPVSVLGGVDDVDVGVFDTTLNPQVSGNTPVAYHTFEVINKTADFVLEIRWELRFA